MVVFIQNFAEDHAILLPGRIPGYNRFDLQLLPSNTSKLSIWESYTQSIEPLGVRVAGYKSFRNIWTKYLPQIIITKPMSDLCWTCQQNNSLIVQSTNKSEEEKSTVSFKFQDIYMYMYMHKIINNINHYRYVLTIFQALKLAEQHLLAVSKERSYFRTVVKTSKDEVKEHFKLVGVLLLHHLTAAYHPPHWMSQFTILLILRSKFIIHLTHTNQVLCTS